MVLRDRYGCWSFIDLWRIAPGEAFSSEDETFLAGHTRPRIIFGDFFRPTQIVNRSPPLPTTVAQLLAVEAGVDDHPARARVHLANGLLVTVRAARIGDPDATDSGIAVTIEPTRPLERMSLFVRAFGLTDRETELVRNLADDADTHQIAAAKFISEHTVQDHLKSSFSKTGARNRRTLVARLRGGD